jgi:hypothetical protein
MICGQAYIYVNIIENSLSITYRTKNNVDLYITYSLIIEEIDRILQEITGKANIII